LLEALATEEYLTPEGVILTAFRVLAGPQDLRVPAPFVAADVYARIATLPFGTPACWAAVSAHDYPGRPQAEPLVAVHYTDGFMRTIQSTLALEPASDGAARWVTSGALRYNSRATVFIRYQPFFSPTCRYIPNSGIGAEGAGSVLHYDALDRLVRVDTPEGFFSRTIIGPWSIESWDAIDTICESIYYAAHPGGHGLAPNRREALLQAVLSSGTPRRTILDPMGSSIARIELLGRSLSAGDFEAIGLSPTDAAAARAALRTNGFLDFRGAVTTAFQPQAPGFSLDLPPSLATWEGALVALLADSIGGRNARPLVTRYGRDVLGRTLWAADPRLSATWSENTTDAMNLRTGYSLTGAALHVVSADAGESWRVPDITGQTVYSRDARGLVIMTGFDALRRQITTGVAAPGAQPATAIAYLYGDTTVGGTSVVDDPAADNLIGEPYQIYDAAGLTQIDAYTLTGNAMRVTRRLLATPGAAVNWLDPNASSLLLEATSWSTARVHDAQGRRIESTDAIGTQASWQYDRAGHVRAIAMAPYGQASITVASSFTYTPSAQRASVVYGNGVTATFIYDALTLRLIEQRAVRRDGVALQDLAYTYDPVGNVTHRSDAAFRSLFGPDIRSDDRAYTYDSLYRLIRATGLELTGYLAADEQLAGYDGLTIALGKDGIPPVRSKAPSGVMRSTTAATCTGCSARPRWARHGPRRPSWTRHRTGRFPSACSAASRRRRAMRRPSAR
jgi:insecticidal toxin complex protein TccC